MIYLIAPTFVRAVYWCKTQDPPINPRGRDITIVTPSMDGTQRLRGVRWEEGDRLVNMGGMDQDIYHALKWMGAPV